MKRALIAIWPLAALATLVGCATPQEIAVRNYCGGKGYDQYPPSIVTTNEQQYLRVGEKVTGQTKTCTSSKDDKGTRTETCTNQDIVEGIYEWRTVPVSVDTNAPNRNLVVQTCSADAMRQGLYAELNDKK